mmetsp:Transcript_11478/g.18388  ORF Transcript_11478/g.18388 Transcript_11478/m.18388 type:complete len:294 (+) Transcript_11478:244-1125(+)
MRKVCGLRSGYQLPNQHWNRNEGLRSYPAPKSYKRGRRGWGKENWQAPWSKRTRHRRGAHAHRRGRHGGHLPLRALLHLGGGDHHRPVPGHREAGGGRGRRRALRRGPRRQDQEGEGGEPRQHHGRLLRRGVLQRPGGRGAAGAAAEVLRLGHLEPGLADGMLRQPAGRLRPVPAVLQAGPVQVPRRRPGRDQARVQLEVRQDHRGPAGEQGAGPGSAGAAGAVHARAHRPQPERLPPARQHDAAGPAGHGERAVHARVHPAGQGQAVRRGLPQHHPGPPLRDLGRGLQGAGG